MTRRCGSVVGDLVAHAAAPWMRRKAHKLSHRNALTRRSGRVLQADFLFAKPVLFAAICARADFG
jgi:hypothetical protein